MMMFQQYDQSTTRLSGHLIGVGLCVWVFREWWLQYYDNDDCADKIRVKYSCVLYISLHNILFIAAAAAPARLRRTRERAFFAVVAAGSLVVVA